MEGTGRISEEGAWRAWKETEVGAAHCNTACLQNAKSIATLGGALAISIAKQLQHRLQNHCRNCKIDRKTIAKSGAAQVART